MSSSVLPFNMKIILKPNMKLILKLSTILQSSPVSFRQYYQKTITCTNNKIQDRVILLLYLDLFFKNITDLCFLKLHIILVSEVLPALLLTMSLSLFLIPLLHVQRKYEKFSTAHYNFIIFQVLVYFDKYNLWKL